MFFKKNIAGLPTNVSALRNINRKFFSQPTICATDLNFTLARELSHVWRVCATLALQTRGKFLTFGGISVVRRSKRAQPQHSLTKLALEVHWTSNPSEFPLRIAFARAILRSGRSLAHTKHNLVPKTQPHEPALPSSLLTKADLACVESTPCFQP